MFGRIYSKIYLGYRILKAKFIRPDISDRHIKKFQYLDESLLAYFDLLESRKDISAEEAVGVNRLCGQHSILITRPDISLKQLQTKECYTLSNYANLLETRQDVSLDDYIKIMGMRLGIGFRYIKLLSQRKEISVDEVFSLHQMLEDQKKAGCLINNYFFLGQDFDFNYIIALSYRPDISINEIMKIKKIFQIQILSNRKDITVDEALKLKGGDKLGDIIMTKDHPMMLSSSDISVAQYCEEHPNNCILVHEGIQDSKEL